MASRRGGFFLSSLLMAVFGLGWCTSVLAGGTKPAPQTQSAEAMVEAAQREAAALRKQVQANPRKAETWKALIEKLNEIQGLRASIDFVKGGFTGLTSDEFMGIRQSPEALAAAKEWVRRAPEEPEAYVALVDLYDGRPQEQEPLIQQFLRKWPNRPEGYQRKARLLASRGDEPGAMAVIEKFMADHPDDPKAYSVLFNSYTASRLGEKGRVLVDEWYRRFPSDPDAIIARATIHGADLSTEDILGMSRVLAGNKNAAQRLPELCQSLMDRHQYAAAIECMRPALADKAVDGEARYYQNEIRKFLAKACFSSGDIQHGDEILASLEPDVATSLRISIAEGASQDGNCDLALSVSGPLIDRKFSDYERSRVAAIRGGCGEKDWASRELLDLLANERIDPDALSASIALYGLIELGQVQEARRIIEQSLMDKPADENRRQERDQLDEEANDDARRIR